MRIAVLAVNDFTRDPRARVLTYQLRHAGHDVTPIHFGDSGEGTVVSRHQPPGSSIVSRAIRKTQSTKSRDQRRTAALVAATVGSGADLIHPTTAAAMEAAVLAGRKLGSPVARAPQWPSPGDLDLISLAPARPSASAPIIGGLDFHTPAHQPTATYPAEGRHHGYRIALAYRKTDSNPGKYLEAACRRAGMTIDLFTDQIDFDELHPDTAAVVFVEGPYPAIGVQGATPDIPIAFWVHHGEHHLAANLRLAERYRADLILLAHSWHLAHFFRQPVQRFPFGMAPDLFDGSTPIADRMYDVAMVGAYIRGGGPYEFRGRLTTSLEANLPSTAFEENVSASRMAELYEQARIIPNEGGTRHFPITMRVLEAIGAGAVLVTQPIPGLDQILEPGEHFVIMDGDFLAQFERLLGDQAGMQRMVDAARAHVGGRHLYDHRVDELIAGLEASEKASPPPERPREGGLSGLIDHDVEVQRLLVASGTDLAMVGREIWTDVDQPVPGSYEAVVFRGSTPSTETLMAARRYIYAETTDLEPLRAFLSAHHPDAEVEGSASLVRADLKAASYRVV